MSCPIYCLVSRSNELDPLVDELRDAGIRPDRIMIVRRGSWRPVPAGPPKRDRRESAAISLWNLPLGPAAWWWPLAMVDWRAIGRSTASTSEVEVIPLASYEAKRQSGGR